MYRFNVGSAARKALACICAVILVACATLPLSAQAAYYAPGATFESAYAGLRDAAKNVEGGEGEATTTSAGSSDACNDIVDESAADAENGVAKTKVYIVADDTKILASAPSEIHVKINGDGTFITPDATAAKIVNKSIFGIRVSKITVSESNSFNIVNSSAQSSTTDAINMTITPNSGTPIDLSDYKNGGKSITDTTDWDIQKASAVTTGTDGTQTATDEIALTYAGSIANVTKDMGQEHEFAEISWTFAAGTIATGSNL
jgi:hypothetical protein